MVYKKLVTILFVTTVFFFHLNLSSNDSINLRLLSYPTQTTNEVSLQMQTLTKKNTP